MTSVTAENAERIKQIVLDCSIRRLSAQETAELLKQKGYPVDVRTVKRYRARIKESAQEWISKLARSKKADYIAEYKSRIDEIYKCQSKLWSIVDSEKTRAHTKVEAIGRLLNCTGTLVELYDSVPLLNAIRDYDNNDGNCSHDHQ